MKSKKRRVVVTRTGRRLVLALVVTLGLVAFTSCNVTRTVTTQSQFFQRGDTTTTIVTKTIESYDATKKN